MNRRNVITSFGIAAGLLTAACGTTSTGPIESEEELQGGGILEINLQVNPENRGSAANVFQTYLQPFLDTADGATSKRLLIRDEEVQVLHGFETKAQADGYLESELFNEDVVKALAPFLAGPPEVRVYDKLAVEPRPEGQAGAILEITLDIDAKKRESAAGVYLKYRDPFLDTIDGAVSKDLVIRQEDVQVIHGFTTKAAASAYLESDLFQQDVVSALSEMLNKAPDVRIFSVFQE